MNLRFQENALKAALRPLTDTRSAAELRLGILTIREKWERLLAGTDVDNVQADAGQVPSPGCNWERQENRVFLTGSEHAWKQLAYPWHLFQYNDWAIRADWQWVTGSRTSAPIPASNTVLCPENVFIEPGAVVECSIINATEGPVYIGRNAIIMEGCILRGPVAICEGATLKMGARIYGGTTIGPYCVAGGEIKNSILLAYSNKAHDGYLGDSVIGAWCNLGAGTSTSNVKNTAGTVSMWNVQDNAFHPVGLKAGLIMGDYSRSAINTSFNTGTVVGVSCNIFDAGFPPRYIPDFTWGNNRYELDKALAHIRNWKALKGHALQESEINLLEQLYHQTT